MDEELRQITAIYDMAVEFFVNYSFQLVGAVLILIIGFWLGGRIAALVLRLCERHSLDATLAGFFANTAKLLVIAIMSIIAMGKLGISIGPFVAALGAVSLGAGLAIQSPLSNYGAGLNIILTRPFVVGDTIKVQAVTGIVKEIRLAYTLLTNEDGVEIIIPNKHIIGEVIHNSHEDTLIELEVGISYHADPDQAIAAVKQALQHLDISTSRNQPEIGIDNFADSNVTLAVRLWAPTISHYQIRYQANSAIYTALKNANIEIAFPQREIKMLP
ncbi:mechanosensitive ion channel family protein [Oceanicoccus sagamiensis]|nr:mechanosensitive ion channel family protein [Oceanicoccus sagamiensis]